MSRLSNARTELENYEKTRPADYVSQYQPKIKDVMGQLDGMKEFDYDPDADTAYQQYKSQYTSRWLNGILSAVQLAAQILPFFFV